MPAIRRNCAYSFLIVLLVGFFLFVQDSEAQLSPGTPVVQGQQADNQSEQRPSILTELATTSRFKLQVEANDLFNGSFIGTEGEVPVYRINTGGSAVAAGDGSAIGWSEDTASSPSAYLTAGEVTATTTTTSQTTTGEVGATTALEIFQSERWDQGGGDEMQWDFPVTSGTDYKVRLYFSEIAVTTSGGRVFDVQIEGSTPAALDDLDVFNQAGGQHIGFMIEIELTASDSNLDIDFIHITQNPKISAIEILEDDNTSTPSDAVPVLVDIDNDGDLDAFIGEFAGTINYIQNTGSASAAVFTAQTGSNNPLSREDVGDAAHPAMADLDNDNDFDLLIGDGDGTFHYYQNTGSVSSPTFTEQTGGSNPMDSEDIGSDAAPVFVDIDGDNDFDLFIGESSGAINFYENTGSVSSPAFTEQTGASNPFNGIDLGSDVRPAFLDYDGDGDYDAFFGENDGQFYYYQNTGTASVPSFSLVTGVANPFNGVDLGDDPSPYFADIDNDTDLDAFFGVDEGTLYYYKNQEPAAGPGGLIDDLHLWVKVDEEVAVSFSAVSEWKDQSGYDNHAVQTNTTYQPSFQDTVLNYQPGILFAGDFLDTSLEIQAASVPDVTVVFVYIPSADPAGTLWGASAGDWDRFTWDTASYNNAIGIGGGSNVVTGITNLYVTDQANIATIAFDEDAVNGSSAYVNGTLQQQFTADQDAKTGVAFEIGSWGGGEGSSSKFQGHIFEGLVYKDLLSTQEQNQVETYLALKYGITLSHNYIASDVTTLWDVTTNASYSNDIAGIGRDDNSALNQKQSRSHSGGIVEMGLGALATDNASNSNTFSTDLSFMIWGHDNGSTTVGTAYGSSTRMARVWTVEEMGSVGTVEVQLPSTYAVTHLIVSASSSMTTPVEYTLTDNGDGTQSTTVDFSDGAFFTFGNGVSPGGVSANLALWLKADTGGYTDDSCTTVLTSSDSADAVACWEDQSGNGHASTQSTSGFRPDYSSSGVNYNPTFVFDEVEDDYLQFSSAPISAASDVHAYYVIDDNDDDGAGNVYANNGPNNGRTYLLSDRASFGDNASVSITKPSGYYLVTTEYDVATTTMYFNADAGTNISESLTFSVTPAGPYRMGAYGGGVGSDSWHYNGELAEFIIYTADHGNGDDEQKIQSYLSIKYGISLPINLLSANGTTLWNVTTNASYSNDIAGIGRDDASALDQRQSTSQSGGIVQIGLGALATDNASNANAFSADASFMVWGHDNGSSSVATDFSGTNVISRMARIWTVEETGTVGTVEVQLPNSYGANYLIVSSSSSLTSPTEYFLTNNGDGTRSTTVDFSDGAFFTFGVGTVPGGVSANLALWLRADLGVTESSGDVSVWADQSGNGRNASDSGTPNLPSVSATAVNYNPAIEFDASNSEGLLTSSVFGTDTHDNINVFYVSKTNTITNSHAFDERQSSSVRVSGHMPWLSNNTIFWDAGGISGNNRLSTSWTESVSTLYIWNFEYEASSTRQAIYRDGTSIISDATVTAFALSSSSGFEIANSGSGDYYDADVAEIIVYTGAVSDAEQNQIETYLGLKYGTSLGHDYVASDGTTLWNATTNASYHNEVAGIGRDDASGLNQKQSDIGILSVAIGALAADNASNSGTFSTDLAFLILGHDNGALTETSTTIGGSGAQRLSRIWLAEETSESGALEVRVDLSTATITGTTASDFQLVLDTNTDPSDGYRALVNAASFSSNIATFSSVDIEDGDYLLVITSASAGSTDDPLTDGQAGDGVLGQPDFDSSTANNGGVSAARLSGPSSIATGPTGKLFIADTRNNRILRWSSANAIVDGSAAEAVLGQADFTSTSANRGASVAANTLYEPVGIYITSSGALYVADSRNNRILRFDNAESASDGANADAVLGQADFISGDPNRRQNVAANSLRQPRDVYVDGSGNLWVADYLNHRVLRYDNVAAKANGDAADGVLGQEVFTTNLRIWKDGNTDADSFVFPSGVYVDGSGVLWVADAGNSRVLRYDNVANKADGADADGVLGQDDFTSWKAHKGGQPAAGTLHWPEAGLHGDNNGRLYVADRWGDRVLWYHNAATKANGADADGVIGQPGFTSRHGAVDNASFNSVTDVFVDTSTDYIWVVDNAHNRALRFDGLASAIGKRAVAFVISQLDFWLQAGEGVYVDPKASVLPESNEDVGVWIDQSIHRFTAVSELPPVFVQGAINGYPVISFDAPDASMVIHGGLFGEVSFDQASVWTVKDLIPGAQSNFVLSFEHNGTVLQYGVNKHHHVPVTQHDEPTTSGEDLLLGSPGTTGAALAELILTYKNLSVREQQVITSYLALKYGFTIDGPYLNSKGDTLWSDTNVFNKDIAGIGRDEPVSLEHLVSTPYGGDFPLTLSVESNQNVEDGAFLLWAHNGESLSIDQLSPVDIAPFRMARTWKLSRIGGIDSVTVYLPENSRAEYLLLDVQASFVNPEIYPLEEIMDGIQIAVDTDSLFLTLAATRMYNESPDLPVEFALRQNYPNPFTTSTMIPFDLPEDAPVSLIVYDLLGRQVITVMDEELPAGRHQVAFIPAGMATGIYFYVLRVGSNEEVRKMIYRR